MSKSGAYKRGSRQTEDVEKVGNKMNTRKFRERASIIRQESLNAPIQHLGYITTDRTLRVLEEGHLRRTKTPDRVVSIEIDGQEISLDVDFSQALFGEFFPGFTSFGEDSYSEAEEYLKEKGIFK
jgi:hypothetical protein